MTFHIGTHSYDLDGGWGRVGPEYEFNWVSGLAVDLNDNVYVFNLATHDLMIFDREGELLRIWPHWYENAHGIRLDADRNLYIVDRDAHCVMKYSSDGELILELGIRGEYSDSGYSLEEGRRTNWVNPVERAAGPFNVPSGVAVNDRGDIFVSDGYANCRVHKFDAEGQLVMSWGVPGKVKPGEFHLVHGIVLDGRGRIIACDRQNDRLQVFTQEGEFVAVWDRLKKPSSVAVGPNGVITVAEFEGRVSHLDGDGQVLARWNRDDGDFVMPHGVAVDSRGDIYVGDVSTSQRIKKFVRI